MITSTRSLSGQPVLITRPSAQAAGLEARLRTAGAAPFHCPMLEIELLWQQPQLQALLPRLADFAWVIVSSQNAVGALAQALQAQGYLPGQALTGPELAAVGPRTAAALATLSGRAVHQPPRAEADSLAVYLAQQGLNQRKVLYLRGRQARQVLPDQLRAAGALLSEIVVYHHLPPSAAARGQLVAWLTAHPQACLTFASPSAVTHFVALIPEWQQLAPAARVVVIGPITAEAAQTWLGRVDAVAAEAGDTGLIRALEECHV